MSRLKRGPASPSAPPPASTPAGPVKYKVLFLCIGNSCRSQMAEGFARKYGADVMDVASAGLSPISYVDPLTVKTMKEWGIDISAQYPKAMADAANQPWDLIVNMSGLPMPGGYPGQVLNWNVRDPFRLSEPVFQDVARQVEGLVQGLVLTLRRSLQQV